MPLQLENKNIVVVGGTSGIGLSAAKYLKSNGAKVVIIGLETTDAGGLNDFEIIYDDVLNEGIVEAAIEKCAHQFGTVDGLLHVAGGSGRKWGDGPLHELTNEGWEKTVDLNLKSVMISNRAAVQYFIKNNKGGSIVNIGSVLANHPSSKYFYTHAYAASKSGIIGFSKSIAAYYASYNIRVNVVSPALTDTPMAQRALDREEIQHFIESKQPLEQGRVGLPSDLDAAICYFLSDGSLFTTGQILNVDGGWSISEGQFK